VSAPGLDHVDQLSLEAEIETIGNAADEADHSFLRRTETTFLESSGDISIVDLFSGCGGMTIGALDGARRVGRRAELALAVDLAEAPLAVLRATLGGPSRRFRQLDLADELRPFGTAEVSAKEKQLFRAVSRPSVLLAGPPCQGHSALNNHTRHDDPRNDLYLMVARAAQIFEPDAVVVENVRGVGSDRRSAVARCQAALEALGYHLTADRVNLHSLGVPQTRVRHVLVATRRPFALNLPQRPRRSVRWAIDDLLEAKRDTVFDSPSKPTPVNSGRIDWLFDNDSYNLPNELRPRCHHSDHSYKSMYGRLRWDAPAQTMTSGFGSMGQGRFVHPLERRMLTPHEAARLQCLPDFMDFSVVARRTALAEMIGNVAPPLLAAALIEALVEQEII
jgi:DNA (cytosine-5)-methyltransferase 1